MIRNGWLHSGDVAVMDGEGYFKIVDRLKDMILVSGFNVYPNEVEDVLYHHPAISKVAVIGVPDDRTGERVKAFVVLKEGATLTSEELIAWCRDPGVGLTGYRIPHEVEFRDSLPEPMVGRWTCPMRAPRSVTGSAATSKAAGSSRAPAAVSSTSPSTSSACIGWSSVRRIPTRGAARSPSAWGCVRRGCCAAACEPPRVSSTS